MGEVWVELFHPRVPTSPCTRPFHSTPQVILIWSGVYVRPMALSLGSFESELATNRMSKPRSSLKDYSPDPTHARP